MFINSEILKYVASIIISLLSFLLVRAIRFGDKLEERIEDQEKRIVIIETTMGIKLSRSAASS